MCIRDRVWCVQRRPERPGGRAVGQDQCQVAHHERGECKCTGLGLGDAGAGPGEGGQHGGKHPQALHQRPPQRGATEQRCRGITRRALHHVAFGRLVLERDRAGGIDDEFEQGDVHRVQQGRPAEQHRQHRHARDRHVQDVYKRQDKGELLAEIVAPGDRFPMRLSLRGPTSSDLSERFDEVRTWAAGLQQSAGCRLVTVSYTHLDVYKRQFRHRRAPASRHHA